MNHIHPTAIVAEGATIGTGAHIGPFCTVGPEVTIGAGTRLISHVVVDGRTTIGEDAVLFPFCTVGMAPQDKKYAGEPTTCEIGARTQIREHVTIHRGTVTGTGNTRVGADCLLMGTSHVAHDCDVGDGVVIANNVAMGGHVVIGDFAVIGGNSAIHQFVRLGRGAMIGGLSGIENDVIPFGTAYGDRARLRGLNIIGLRRRGYEKAAIHALRSSVRTLFWSSGLFAGRLAEVRTAHANEPLVAEVLAFIAAPSKRGLLRSAAATDGDDEA